jgi:hypothetical protein
MSTSALTVSPSAAHPTMPSWLIFLIGFCCPVAGYLLYSDWKDRYPVSARTANRASIIGALSGLAGWLLYRLVTGTLIPS